ncbi:MAG: flagellar basal body L-ring protein FlgH [Phycisphaerales bacterium]|nr:flagellar basal body L-ring protein FlgH [Phycisphaerales bacterium]
MICARLCMCTAFAFGCEALGQTSSLGKRTRQRVIEEAPAVAARADAEPAPRIHPAVQKRSLIAVEPKPPRIFAVGDHVTIIVREQLSFKSDADSQSKNDFQVQSELEAFFKPIDGGLGSTGFARGKPNVDYKYKQNRKNEADVSSENRLVTRLTGEIIDIKPNGNLVICAKARIEHGEEKNLITLTGTCSRKKLSADDSVLSTDMADKCIKIENSGVVNDGARRGWLSKILDSVKPF